MCYLSDLESIADSVLPWHFFSLPSLLSVLFLFHPRHITWVAYRQACHWSRSTCLSSAAKLGYYNCRYYCGERSLARVKFSSRFGTVHNRFRRRINAFSLQFISKYPRRAINQYKQSFKKERQGEGEGSRVHDCQNKRGTENILPSKARHASGSSRTSQWNCLFSVDC